jgi:MFS family permease
MAWLVGSPSFWHLLAVELWLSFLYGCYNGAMIVYLTEIMPEDVRTSGFSMAYSLATIVGGMAPAICTALIQKTGDGAMPRTWMALAAAAGLAAIWLVGRQPALQAARA